MEKSTYFAALHSEIKLAEDSSVSIDANFHNVPTETRNQIEKMLDQFTDSIMEALEK